MVVLGTAVLLVVALVTAVQTRTSHRRDATRSAALRGAALGVVFARAEGTDQDARVLAVLRLADVGSGPLRLGPVRLDDPGWAIRTAPVARLAVGDEVVMAFVHLWRCESPDPVPTAVLASAEVPGAGRRSFTLPLGTGARAEMTGRRDATCGALPAGRAVDLGRTTLTVERTRLALDIELFNRSTSPVTVRSVSVPGLRTAVDRLPVVLPPRPRGSPAGRPPSTRLHLSLTFAQCLALGQFRDGAPVPTAWLGLAVTGRGGAARTRVVLDGLSPLLVVLHEQVCGRAVGTS